MQYRPAIDGLRAVAIIFIILSHFKELNFVSGGVNIFFVISGYLITHIFLSQQLDISKFYKTRFLKLYPNIFIISLITFILFFLIGDFIQWSIILSSFISTISGLFNIYLILIGDVYGQENYINPFLPFWAFCVIIQFYIIYPIILKIIFYIKKKFKLNNDFIINSLFAISIVLFLFYFFFRTNTFFSFYSPLSRYWQFIIGGCLYFVIRFKKKLYFNNFTIYFAIIFLIIWQLNLEWFYSWKKVQVLLTITTLLFLYSAHTNIFNKILSSKFLTLIGKFSFELYLIHMGVIYFISLWFDQMVVIISLILLIFTTFLFIKFINSFLFQKLLSLFRNKVIILSSFFIFLNSGVYALIKNEAKFKNSFSSINAIEKIKINTDISFENKYKDSFKFSGRVVKSKNGHVCHNISVEGLYAKECQFIEDSNNQNFFLIGGSQVDTLSHDLRKRLKNYDYAHFTASAFVYLPNFDSFFIRNNKKDEDFTIYNKFIRDSLLSVNKKTIVVIGARYPLYLNETYFDNKESGVEGGRWVKKLKHIENLDMKWEDGFKISIKELSKNKNINIILIYPIPEVGFNVIEKLKKYKFFTNEILDTSFTVFKERTKSSFELLDSIQGENIYRVYPHTLFCNTTIKNRCILHDEKNIFYSDDNHPSSKGAKMINDLIVKEIQKIEQINH